ALDAADDLERPFALELVEDHLEERRPAARPGRSLVAVLADRGLDPRPRLGGDVLPPVQDLRHGRNGDPGHLRDVRHGRRIRPTGARLAGRRHARSVTNLPVRRKFRAPVAAGTTHVPAVATRFGRIVEKSRMATVQWPSRNYRRALRNFRGGDPRPSGCPRKDRRHRTRLPPIPPRQTPPPWPGR